MKESPVKVGEILAGKYRVESVLGVGGMGIVVEATHLELNETRAIKLMLPEALEQEEMVSRFKHEARAVVRLKSEYVARVLDVGTLENGLPYMVMEYLRGSDLRTIIKERGKIPVPEAVHYALQTCEALAEAHALGIVHRDLKPANLFLITRTDGTPGIKVLDFGISKMLGNGDDEMTKTQAVLGSPSYMSPEQMRSARTVDARTDIWSLGVILYRLVTGELPFRADTITELVTKVLQSAPRRPSAIAPDIPHELDEVLLRCLERDLSKRYADVGELSAALFPFAPSDTGPSVERIARVLATTSGSAIPVPRALTASISGATQRGRGSSGDAWVNTDVGNGTVAVRKWKLLALGAGAGALALAGGVSLVLSHLAAGPAHDGVASDPKPRAPAEPASPAPAGVPAAPALAAVRPASTSVTSPTHPDPPDRPPDPSTTTPAPAAPMPVPAQPATAVAVVKGPMPTAYGSIASPPTHPVTKPVKPTEPAVKLPDPSPPPSPPPVTTAPHRVFGIDN